jgi:hypothetical protein
MAGPLSAGNAPAAIKVVAGTLFALGEQIRTQASLSIHKNAEPTPPCQEYRPAIDRDSRLSSY